MGLFRCFAWAATWLAAAAAESPQTSTTVLAFDVHDGYFVSNRFEADAAQSFVLLKDQASFDEVFGVGRVMGDQSHRLPDDAFDRKLVVAAIHRGNALVTYQVKNVSAEGDTLVLNYAAARRDTPDTQYACPLIVSLERADYAAVRFVENGRVAKRLATATPAKAADGITTTRKGGECIAEIRGKGIGRGSIPIDPATTRMILRVHLAGLESLALSNNQTKWTAAVLSHGDHASLIHLWREGKEGPQLTRESPYWTDIKRLDATGNPAAGLPPKGGRFELVVPPGLWRGHQELTVQWIDFYR